MFGIGFVEILVIALVVVVFVNPKDLPRLFRWVGRLARQFRDLKDSSIRYLDKAERELEKAEPGRRPARRKPGPRRKKP